MLCHVSSCRPVKFGFEVPAPSQGGAVALTLVMATLEPHVRRSSGGGEDEGGEDERAVDGEGASQHYEQSGSMAQGGVPWGDSFDTRVRREDGLVAVEECEGGQSPVRRGSETQFRPAKRRAVDAGQECSTDLSNSASVPADVSTSSYSSGRRIIIDDDEDD